MPDLAKVDKVQPGLKQDYTDSTFLSFVNSAIRHALDIVLSVWRCTYQLRNSGALWKLTVD
jgi:hypothetical protein